MVQYQTAVLRGDLESASKLLPSIPNDQRSRIARFLESQNLKELALEVSTDAEQKFDLAVQLGKLEVATEIAKELDSEARWRTLSDVALANWKFDLAEDCLRKANDLGGMLLFYIASGNKSGLRQLADLACKFNQRSVYLLRPKLTDALFSGARQK